MKQKKKKWQKYIWRLKKINWKIINYNEFFFFFFWQRIKTQKNIGKVKGRSKFVGQTKKNYKNEKNEILQAAYLKSGNFKFGNA